MSQISTGLVTSGLRGEREREATFPFSPMRLNRSEIASVHFTQPSAVLQGSTSPVTCVHLRLLATAGAGLGSLRNHAKEGEMKKTRARLRQCSDQSLRCIQCPEVTGYAGYQQADIKALSLAAFVPSA